MSDDQFPIKAPDPVAVAQLAGQVRALMPAIGGIVGTLGITLPAVTESQLADILSAAMVLFGVVSYGAAAVWSWWQKRAAEKAKRDAEVSAAVASAAATMEAQRPTPVTVTVTPEGQPNEAVRVSAAEQRAAPTVPVNVTPSPAPRAA